MATASPFWILTIEITDLPVEARLVQPGNPPFDFRKHSLAGADRQNGVEPGNGNEPDARLFTLRNPGEDASPVPGRDWWPGCSASG